ncbi:hypothetical protein [Neolewinella xylanilytica]|uniref:hypothetical protein n=1 Tax=Neolewinella xylanilytica TaxID=1514080 RepID=UPI000CEB0317|nr:hypothetical protein [Neolewinella xylanilytica]
MNYLHFNPVAAKLVDHPGEWGYSSHYEYADFTHAEESICNVTLGRKLLESGRNELVESGNLTGFYVGSYSRIS